MPQVLVILAVQVERYPHVRRDAAGHLFAPLVHARDLNGLLLSLAREIVHKFPVLRKALKACIRPPLVVQLLELALLQGQCCPVKGVTVLVAREPPQQPHRRQRSVHEPPPAVLHRADHLRQVPVSAPPGALNVPDDLQHLLVNLPAGPPRQ